MIVEAFFSLCCPSVSFLVFCLVFWVVSSLSDGVGFHYYVVHKKQSGSRGWSPVELL